MAGSRPTFLKRQKERARQEKQRAKAERRLQRKEKGPETEEPVAQRWQDDEPNLQPSPQEEP
jgi:hypothetical protein